MSFKISTQDSCGKICVRGVMILFCVVCSFNSKNDSKIENQNFKLPGLSKFKQTFIQLSLFNPIGSVASDQHSYGKTQWLLLSHQKFNKSKAAMVHEPVSLAPLNSLHSIKYCTYLLLPLIMKSENPHFLRNILRFQRLSNHDSRTVLSWQQGHCGYLLQQLYQWICWWHPIPWQTHEQLGQGLHMYVGQRKS